MPCLRKRKPKDKQEKDNKETNTNAVPEDPKDPKDPEAVFVQEIPEVHKAKHSDVMEEFKDRLADRSYHSGFYGLESIQRMVEKNAANLTGSMPGTGMNVPIR